MGAFTIEALQLWETLNILSFTLSLGTLLYGIGENVALRCHGNVEVDFSMTVFGVLANMIDAGLRVPFFAYISTIIKGYVFLILLSYIVILFIITCYQNRQVLIGQKFLLSGFLGNAMQSLPCSGLERAITLQQDRVRNRTISKSVFS